jgi:hypothetical protein
LSNLTDFQEEFIDELKHLGLSWLVLGKINYMASRAIKDVDGKVDQIMCNLPTKKEALAIVQREADPILSSLTNENSFISN